MHRKLVFYNYSKINLTDVTNNPIIVILETIVSIEDLRKYRGFLHLYHIDVYVLIKYLVPCVRGFFVWIASPPKKPRYSQRLAKYYGSKRRDFSLVSDSKKWFTNRKNSLQI